MTTVRVRFAPSPTGPLHIGGMRTALFNYLFARHNNGSFILRIEDTDQSRYVPGAEEYITESLRWCGVIPDEGPGFGGDFGPYRQSERLDTYQKYAQELVEAGHAYYAFDTPEELEEARERYSKAGDHFRYDSSTRMEMSNGLTLEENNIDARIERGETYVVRVKIPEEGEVQFEDRIRGNVSVLTSELDDKVILKSDGNPTYHLANVVDDHLMAVTHVIRGEEWLPSTPLHVLLYRFLGWEDERPEFAHLPLLLKPDGKGKLSKRDGAKHGFPVFPMDWTDEATGEKSPGFKEMGFLPDALINFLAFLGWNPATEQEIFTLDELAKAFSLEHVHKGGAKFDIEKARWFNQQYFAQSPQEALIGTLSSLLEDSELPLDRIPLDRVVEALRERIVMPEDMLTNGRFFFQRPSAYDEGVISKRWNEDTASVLKEYASRLRELPALSSDNAKETLDEVSELKGIPMGQVMQLLRVVVTGETKGPDLMEAISILGGKEVSSRITEAVDTIESGIDE